MAAKPAKSTPAAKPARNKAAPKAVAAPVKSKAPAKSAGKSAPAVLADTPKRPATKAAAPDWGRIEMDFRAGLKSNREIGAEHGITEGAIRKKAKQEDWVRDLSAKIHAKADDLVRREAVRSEVRANQVAKEKDVIDANAQAIVTVRLAHRQDIARARKLTNAMLLELELCTDPAIRELLAGLPRLVLEADASAPKLAAIFEAIMSLPERSKTMKTLAESMQKLVDMERTAYDMDNKDQGPKADPLTALLDSLTNGNGNTFRPVANDPERAADTPPISGFGPQPEGDDDGNGA